MSALLHDKAKTLQEYFLILNEPKKRAEANMLDLSQKILLEFDEFTAELYKIRSKPHHAPGELERIEDLASRISFEILTYQKERPIGLRTRYRSFIREYRTVWREEISLFSYCAFLFCTSCVLGWLVGKTHPEYASAILPQNLVEDIYNHQAWFHSLQKDPILGGIQIAINNIRVSINCFLCSAVLGLGGLLLLCFNGVFFGVVYGFCEYHGFHEEIKSFVVSHGPLELTIIVAASFSGLIFGRVFFQRPWRDFSKRFRREAERSFTVLKGILPWLVLAATFEGLVSPFSYLSTPMKVLFGLVLAVLFWVWTFGPVVTDEEEQRLKEKPL